MSAFRQGWHSISRVLLGCLFLIGLLLFTVQTRPQAAFADTTTATQALNIVQQYQGVWTSPPSVLTGGRAFDGPLMGNGDAGVVVGGTIDNMTFYLGKNDFWSYNPAGVRSFGSINLAIPGLAGASYNMVEDILHAEVRGTFSLNGATINTTSWVSATSNLFVTTFALSGGSAQHATITLSGGGSSGETSTYASTNDVLSSDVKAGALTVDTLGTVATRVLGATATLSSNQMNLTLQPGSTYTLVTSLASNNDSSTYHNTAIANVSGLTSSDIATLNTPHRAWWQNYWSQSFVQIPDKAIEKSWYGSLYLLGCASRPGKFAPGLWGNWIIGNMAYGGNYTLNYNYETQLYPSFSTNHVHEADPYDQAVLDWISNGQTLATQNGDTGVLYPVDISPKGIIAGSSINLLNQKSDAAFAATDMIMRFYYTYDTTYANTIYPYLKQVGTFWQNYLSWDGTRYVILNDAPQENNAYPQTNSVLSLGLVRFLFQGLIDMSTSLNVDASSRTTWQSILDHLSAFPTMTYNGQTVFRQTEVGAGWVNGNDIAIQHVYPGSQIGLDSNPTLLQVAQNTVGQLARWHDNNAPGTFYAAAARVGYDPSTILANMHIEATTDSYNNMYIYHHGGGIENLNVATSGLDEMLLQSFQNDVHLFADWPASTNAKFGDLLSYGAFDLSSDIENNVVQYLRVISQQGRSFTFTNPWPGQTLSIYRNGVSAGTLSGKKITILTSAGETIHIAPAGTSYNEILRRMALSIGPATFATGFEKGDAQPNWINTVDTTKPGGDIRNVSGVCCGLSGPQADVRNETVHTGSTALMYSGLAGGGPAAYSYMKLYDLSTSPITVGAGTTLTYWIYPQSTATSPWATGNSTCVAVDLIFSDGTDLRDSGSVDQYGNRAHPAYQCNHLTLDTWNQVTVNLGTKCSGKQIVRIDLGYDQPNGTGGYRGYIDDLSIN